MPNHVTNKLEFVGEQKKINEILEAIKNDEAGIGSIDFNKIIPMPESLNITSGSVEHNSINAYLTAINPYTSDFGVKKLNDFDYFTMMNKLNSQSNFYKYDGQMSIENMQNEAVWTEKKDIKSLIDIGRQYADNFMKYGATSWYDWAIRSWGSKWSGYDFQAMQENKLTYSTAWSNVIPVITKLSEMYPDIHINYAWADEDIGANVGEMEFENGKAISEHIPVNQSKEAYEMAAEIRGFDLEDYGYVYDPSSCTYEFQEDLDEKESPEMSVPNM